MKASLLWLPSLQPSHGEGRGRKRGGEEPKQKPPIANPELGRKASARAGGLGSFLAETLGSIQKGLIWHSKEEGSGPAGGSRQHRQAEASTCYLMASSRRAPCPRSPAVIQRAEDPMKMPGSGTLTSYNLHADHSDRENRA